MGNATKLQVKKRSNPYRMLDVRAIEDTRLSNKAVGLLARLLVKPTNWQINMNHLAKTYPDGEKALRNAMKELQQFGYAKLETIYDFEQKKAVGKRWTVTDWPEKEELRKLPKGLDKVEFSEKAETAKRSKSGKVKVCKGESLKRATYRSNTSKGSSLQEENNNKNTHTHKGAGVCAEKSKSNNHANSPSDIGTFNGGLSDQQSKQRKAPDRRLNINSYCEKEGIRKADLPGHVASKFKKYLRTREGSHYFQQLNHDDAGHIVSLFFHSKANKAQYDFLLPPSYYDDRDAFENWFARTWSALKYFHDSYCKNHQIGKPVYKPQNRKPNNGYLVDEETLRRSYAELRAEGYK